MIFPGLDIKVSKNDIIILWTEMQKPTEKSGNNYLMYNSKFIFRWKNNIFSHNFIDFVKIYLKTCLFKNHFAILRNN